MPELETIEPGLVPTRELHTGVATNYQYWYRDPGNTCSGAGFNFSNAWTTTWLP